MPATSLKWLILPAVALLVTIFCWSGLLTDPPTTRVAVPPPSPLMTDLQREMFAIRNLFRNATSSHRNRKEVAQSCERIRTLATALRERPESGRWPSVAPTRWSELSDDMARSAGSLEDLVLSRPEPSLAAIRSSYARIVDSCVRCHGETYLSR